jgi:hypothetical protein
MSALYRQRGDSTRAEALVSKLKDLWRNGDPEASRMIAANARSIGATRR